MAQAFLHREQHIAVAPRFDMDHAVGMKPGKVKGRRKKIAPTQAPKYRPLNPCKNPGEKDGCTGVVSKVGTSRDLMQRACVYSPARKVAVERGHAERQHRVTAPCTFHFGDAGAQIGNDIGLSHGTKRTRETGNLFLICSA